MVKIDVKFVFCIIFIYFVDYFLLGLKWENLYYFDRILLMGLSLSCVIFEVVLMVFEWIFIYYFGVQFVLYILDDFFFIVLIKV